MKKTLLLIALVLCCATTIFAQNNKISYQAVVRDTENKLVANKLVNVTVTITDADNHSYTQEFTDVQTNFNGMLSLIIGPDGENAAWNSIHWNHANVVTTITLAGVELGTLTMPLTAVPYAMYAEYADELDPDAAVVIGIYNKILYDSLALGALIDANAANIDNLEEMDEALAARIAADSARLDQRIVADSSRLVALNNRVNTFNTHICDTVNTCLTTALADGTSVINQAIDTIAENIASNYLTTNGYVTSTQLDNHHYLTSDSTVITNLQSEVNTLANSHFVNNAECSNIDFCGLVTKLNNLETTVGGLNSTISEMQYIIDDLNSALAGTRQTINSLQTQNEDLAQRVNELEELVHVVDLSTINSDVVIPDGYKVTGTLNGNHKVTIAAGATVQFEGVNINGNASTDGNHAGITCAGDATIVLAHGSTNIVKGFNANYPGIYVPTDNTLTIEGSGSLDASSNGNAAGIGGGYGLDCGNIRIVEGTVTATGGAKAAGIGGGENGSCGTITITDGVDIVTASKGADAPNSVGAGAGTDSSCGTVTIGGVVYWNGSNYQNDGVHYLTQSPLVYHPVVTGVSLSSTSVEETKDGKFQLSATVIPDEATNKTVIWRVTEGSDKVALYSDAECNTPLSTDAVAAGPIYVKALAEGTATIKVSCGANPAKYAECEVTVINTQDAVTIASTFQYCYDCQRIPAYPVSGSSCTLSGFGNPYVGNRSTTGPWKLEYKGSYSSYNNPYNISLDYYKSKYGIENVPIFELFQWDATQNAFVHAAYGVVCAYSNVTGNVDHTAFFEANNHYGCYLTGQSHMGSLQVTFDQYMSDGLHALIPQQ